MFLSKYECEHDDSKGKCPKTCGICKTGETHALFDGNVLISWIPFCAIKINISIYVNFVKYLR